MLNKTWTFAFALALAAAPISSLLAAGNPNGENATAGTAAANASTPAAKTDPAGAKPSSPEAGDPAASNTGSTDPGAGKQQVSRTWPGGRRFCQECGPAPTGYNSRFYRA
jgi:hypothetical protein